MVLFIVKIGEVVEQVYSLMNQSMMHAHRLLRRKVLQKRQMCRYRIAGDNETADIAQSAIGPDNTLPATSCTSCVHNTEFDREEVILPSTAEQSTQSTESREILTTGEREDDTAEHDEETM